MASAARMSVIALALALAIAFCLDAFFPSAWMPVAFAGAYAVLLILSGWTPKTRFLWAYLVSAAALVLFFWLLSSRFQSAEAAVAMTASLGIGFGSLAFAIDSIRRMPASDRPGSLWMLVPLALACLIAFVSSPYGGPGLFDRFFHDFIGLTTDQTHLAVFLTRKMIHFTFYGTCAILATKAAFAGQATRRSAILFGFLFVVCLASFDELRQTTASNRTGSQWDVMLDLSGAAIFLCVQNMRKRVAFDS